MTTIKRLVIRNSLIYIILDILACLFPFISLVIFTRILAKEAFGIFSLMTLFSMFVYEIANSALSVVYRRNYFQYKSDPKRLAAMLYSSLAFVSVFYLVLVSIISVYKEPLARVLLGSEQWGSLIICALWAEFFFMITNYFFIHFINRKDAVGLAYYNVGRSLASVVAGILFIVILRVGIAGLVYAKLCASVLIFILLAIRFMRELPLTFNASVLVENLKLSIPLSPRMVVGVLQNQFENVLIRLLASIGGVGVYSIGQKISSAVFILMTSLQKVFQPGVYTRMFAEDSTTRESIGRYLTPFAYVSTFIALAVALCAEEIISVMTPPAYHGAINVVVIFAMGYAILFFGKQPQLIYAKKTGLISLLSFVSLGLQVIVGIIFIRQWGIIGAAWAHFVVQFIFMIVYVVLGQHYCTIRWEYKKLAIMYGGLFGIGLAILLLRWLHIVYPLRLLCKLVFLGMYAYYGIRIHVLTKENWQLVKGTLLQAVGLPPVKVTSI